MCRYSSPYLWQVALAFPLLSHGSAFPLQDLIPLSWHGLRNVTPNKAERSNLIGWALVGSGCIPYAPNLELCTVTGIQHHPSRRLLAGLLGNHSSYDITMASYHSKRRPPNRSLDTCLRNDGNPPPAWLPKFYSDQQSRCVEETVFKKQNTTSEQCS